VAEAWLANPRNSAAILYIMFNMNLPKDDYPGAHQDKGVAARYLVSYDWPVAAETAKILARLQGIVGQLGLVDLPVLAATYGKKKPIAVDLFKIEDLSIIEAVETVDDRGNASGLGSLFYSYSKGLDMAVLSIAIPNHHLRPGLIEGVIRTLHEVDGIGYTIAFDAILGRRALYYALGITFGEVRTHYEDMLAHELGRFFFQRTRKHRDDRAYTRDKIRNVYPVNVLNALQKRIMQDVMGLHDERFARLGDDRHLLVLEDAEVLGSREALVGSDFLI
jgi:hypothetical protein